MTTPKESHTRQYSHINGAESDLLDRLAVTELCKGWPVYRDASEWMNFRSLFTDDATVWTTWSGARPVDDFIAISKAGKSSGAFIQHRECGTLVELNPQTDRALGKMKATITQRFATPDGVEFDVDCDCRFLFFCLRETPRYGTSQKRQGCCMGHVRAVDNLPEMEYDSGSQRTKPGAWESAQKPRKGFSRFSRVLRMLCSPGVEFLAHQGTGESLARTRCRYKGDGTTAPPPRSMSDNQTPDTRAWKVKFVKLIYEKDRVVPVDGCLAPKFDREALDKYPQGYRYLGAAQAQLGYDIDDKLATVRDIGTWERMYGCMERWLDGKDPELFWE